MVTGTIVVLDPTVQSSVNEVYMAPRLDDLNGKVISFLWNKKPNGDILLLRIKERLSQRFHLAGTNWHAEKLHESVASDADTIEEITSTSDLVINALAD